MLFCLNLNIWFRLYLFILSTFSPLITLGDVKLLKNETNSYKKSYIQLHNQLSCIEEKGYFRSPIRFRFFHVDEESKQLFNPLLVTRTTLSYQLHHYSLKFLHVCSIKYHAIVISIRSMGLKLQTKKIREAQKSKRLSLTRTCNY